MGMYASMRDNQRGEEVEVKLTGLLYSALSKFGEHEPGFMSIKSGTQASMALNYMWTRIYSGEFVKQAEWASESSPTNMSCNHMNHCISDIENIMRFADWVRDAKDGDELVFA
jgi:hypothetical protein